MWVEWNPNPLGKRVGDCTVRAVAKGTGESWEDAYSGMALEGFLLSDMPSSASTHIALDISRIATCFADTFSCFDCLFCHYLCPHHFRHNYYIHQHFLV